MVKQLINYHFKNNKIMVYLIFSLFLVILIGLYFYVNRKSKQHISIEYELQNVHLMALDGNVFFINNEQHLFHFSVGVLWRFDEQKKTWIRDVRNFDYKKTIKTKYDVAIVDTITLPKKYKNGFFSF